MRISCLFGAKSMLFFNFIIDYFPVSRIVCEIVMLILDFAAGKRFKQSHRIRHDHFIKPRFHFTVLRYHFTVRRYHFNDCNFWHPKVKESGRF